MDQSITLTVAQAHSLQAIPIEEWPGELRFLLDIGLPTTPDGVLDNLRQMTKIIPMARHRCKPEATGAFGNAAAPPNPITGVTTSA